MNGPTRKPWVRFAARFRAVTSVALPGSALLSVLVLCGFLSLLALVAMDSLSTNLRATAVFSDEIGVEMLGRSGLDLLAANLSDPDRPAPAAGSFEARLRTGRISVVYRSDDGKVDLNRAPVELLTLVLAGLGLSPDQAVQNAEMIVAFRRPQVGPNAAPQADASASGRAGEARQQGDGAPSSGEGGASSDGGEFSTVFALAQVPGLDPIVAMHLPNLATVCSSRDGLNPLLADKPMLRVLFGGDDMRAHDYAEKRTRRLITAPDAAAGFPAAVRPFLDAGNEPMAGMQAIVTVETGRLRRRYEARLCPDGANPRAEIRSWRPID